MTLDDKSMAMDALAMCKHGVECLTKAAMECTNERLRQTLLEMRNQEEKSQDKISRVAVTNNWYLTSSPAPHDQVRRIHTFYATGTVGGPAASPGAGGYREERPQPPAR